MSDLPMRACCVEYALEGYGPIVMVGVEPTTRGVRQCPPRHALQGAELLIDHAFTLEPHLATKSADITPLASLLSRLWRASAYALSSLIESSEGGHLRDWLHLEVKKRVDEECALARTAARERGLRDAREVIGKLIAIIGEPNADLRNIALAQVYGEVTRAIGDTGTVHR
jgi:hypothetical protein